MEKLLTILILCFFLLHENSFYSYGRTFKTLTGVAIEGSFVELKTGGSKEIAVLKLDRAGKLYAGQDMPCLVLVDRAGKVISDQPDSKP